MLLISFLLFMCNTNVYLRCLKFVLMNSSLLNPFWIVLAKHWFPLDVFLATLWYQLITIVEILVWLRYVGTRLTWNSTLASELSGWKGWCLMRWRAVYVCCAGNIPANIILLEQFCFCFSFYLSITNVKSDVYFKQKGYFPLGFNRHWDICIYIWNTVVHASMLVCVISEFTIYD